MALSIIHVELNEANEFVAMLHRHHKPVIGHRFSVGCWDGCALVGVAIVGRPVARALDQKWLLEVTRLCTDGTKNACSFLYSACARAGRELGYKKIQTYILESEPATTLKAAGWEYDGMTTGGAWTGTPSRGKRQHAHPTEPKQRWKKDLQ